MKLAIRIIISFVIVLGGFLLFIFTSNDKLDPVIKENCFIRGNMIGESQKEINDADRNGFIINPKYWGFQGLMFTLRENEKLFYVIKAKTDEEGKPLNLAYSIELNKK